MGVEWGGGWLFPVSNILYLLSSKIGLKGCVYGQLAGEVYGFLSSLGREEGEGFCLVHFCPYLSWGQSLLPPTHPHPL